MGVSRFLNCTTGTKLRKTSYILKVIKHIYQSIHPVPIELDLVLFIKQFSQHFPVGIYLFKEFSVMKLTPY